MCNLYKYLEIIHDYRFYFLCNIFIMIFSHTFIEMVYQKKPTSSCGEKLAFILI